MIYRFTTERDIRDLCSADQPLQGPPFLFRLRFDSHRCWVLRDLVPLWFDPFLRWQTLGGSTSHPGQGFLCLDDRHLERRFVGKLRPNLKLQTAPNLTMGFFHLQILRVLYILVNVHRKLWKDPPFLMGKLTINGMFNNKFSGWWLTYPSEN